MKRIPADFQRTVDIAGTAFPRPVDIDKAQTGFTQLRSLRIYRFAAGSVIEGHAEEDEVLIVVLAGSIELRLSGRASTDTLNAVTDAAGSPCVAYLPPGGGYQLTAKSDADIAYARATPVDGPPPQVFYAQAEELQAGVSVLLREDTYPRLLRTRLISIHAGDESVAVQPLEEEEAGFETLVYIRTLPEGGAVTMAEGNVETPAVTSWDTISVASGERPVLHLAEGASALILVVSCPSVGADRAAPE